MAGIAVVAGLGVGSTMASAATGPAVANLGTTVFKISGKTFAPSAKTIPAGTSLQTVSLTTDDPDAGPQGVLGLNNDPTSLLVGETVTIKVNGATVATTVPTIRPVFLVTNAGTITAMLFSVGGNSYAIPRRGQTISAVTTTTATSAMNGPTSGLLTLDYGFLPVGAPARTGRAFVQTADGTVVSSAAARAVTVYDADNIRANSDSVGDELGIGLLLRDGQEILATVQFTDNSFGQVRGVRYITYGAYSYSQTSYLFESVGLAAAGKSINDVRSVVSAATTTHGLTWSTLGLVA